MKGIWKNIQLSTKGGRVNTSQNDIQENIVGFKHQLIQNKIEKKGT